MTKEKFYEDIRKHIANIYSFPVKAKVIKSYTDKNKYFVDVKALDLDGSETKTIYPKCEVPKIFGTANGGIFCVPAKDSIVRINFEQGNKNYPYVESVLGSTFDIEHKENEFIFVNDKQKLYFKNGYALLKCDDNFLIELDKTNQKINIVFDNNIKIEGSTSGWKLKTATDSFDLSDLIELKNSAGSLKGCLDDLWTELDKLNTNCSTITTTGSPTSHNVVPAAFLAAQATIQTAKSKIALIFK